MPEAGDTTVSQEKPSPDRADTLGETDHAEPLTGWWRVRENSPLHACLPYRQGLCLLRPLLGPGHQLEGQALGEYSVNFWEMNERTNERSE